MLRTDLLHMTDAGATDAVWRALSTDLLAWLRRRVPDDAADDLLQDVFLRVHERRGDLRDEDRIAGWVFRVARNAVVDWHRKKRPTAALDAEQPSDDTPNDDSVRLRQTLARWTAATIEDLPEKYRDILKLTELEELPYKTVASRTGLSVSGVKTRVQRGRELLRAKLQRCCTITLDTRAGLLDVQPRRDCC